MWAVLLAAALGLLLLLLAADARKPSRYPPGVDSERRGASVSGQLWARLTNPCRAHQDPDKEPVLSRAFTDTAHRLEASGPQWVPVFGNYFLFYRLYMKIGFTHLVWSWLSKKYGPVLGVRLGKDRLVIASGYPAVKEVLSREQFDARPDGFLFRFRAFGERYGLVFVDGEFFNEQKKFCMKHLKNMGLNRSIMGDRINVETAELVQVLQNCSGKEVSIPEVLEVSVLNSLWTMMAGERFRLDDPRARQLLTHIHASFRLQDMSGGILNQLPFLRFILPQVHTSFTKLRLILHSLTSFIKELVEVHRQSLSPDTNRDLIDAFINEMNKQQGEKTTFTEKQLIILVLDLFLAGAETTSSTLGFAILYLIHYPEIQAKLHQELDTVVGKTKQPFLQHRHSLIYFEAFMMEVQRIVNTSPTTVSHRAKEDVELGGYRIPKDTIVLCSLYSLHMDRDHWGDPENFRPERFINKDGQIIQDEWLMPFGLGKRRCMGEALARTSIYLFLTAILHKFVISQVPGRPLPPIRAQDGATLMPAPFQVVFTPRQ